MKTRTFLFTVITLFLLMVGTGCEKDVQYYSGTVVALVSQNDCYDIIRIDKAPQGGLPIGTSIAPNISLSDESFKVKDVVKFEIISYQELIDPQSIICPHAKYNANIKLK